MSNINQNMLRNRAEKLPPVSDEEWELVNKDFRDLAVEFISAQSHSPKTKIQYESILRQFGWFICNSLNNKPLYKFKKRDFIRYLSYLRDDRKMSSSAQNMRKAVVSSLCNYIENIVAEDDENYETFRNFTRGLPPIPKNQVYEKVKITKEEYDLMMESLEDDENLLGMTWLAVAFNSGARRSEIIQFKTEILEYPINEEGEYVITHNIRLKGKGEDGKIDTYMMPTEALKHIRNWVDNRGYEHEYIFTTKYNGETTQMKAEWADYFCTNVLSPIVGRRINPHLFKSSCITYLLEQGVPIEIVSKYIAHHENVATTISHYDLRSFEEEKNSIFNRKED